MSNSIEIKGLNRLLRQLGNLEPNIKAEVKKVNLDLAGTVASTARSIVPVRSGKLQTSIRTGSTVRSGVVRAGKKLVPYAGPIHFGWPKHNISPNTFLWDALDRRRDEVARRHLDALERIAGQVS